MLMKKIFTLIATALLTMGASAQTTVFSWEAGTATGGTVEAKGSNNAPDDTKITVNSKKADIDVNNVTITLNEALAAGDKIAITGYRNKDTDANGTLYIDFSTGTAIDEGDEVKWNNMALGQEPNTNEYTITDQAGSTVIRMARSKASTNVFITKFVITRAGGGGATGETESYLAVAEDGSAASTEFANPTTEGTDLVVSFTKGNVTLKAVASRTPADIDDASGAGLNQDTWTKWNDSKWDGPKKQNDISFYWMQGSGNPYISFVSEQKSKDGEPLDAYKANYTYYAPDGSKGLPICGEYVEITAKADGMFKIGFWANKGGSRKLYLVDKESKKALIWDADETKTQYKVEGYVNGWDEEWVEIVDGNKVKKAKKRFIPYIQVNDFVIGDPAAVNDKVLDADFNPTTKVVDQVSNNAKFGWFVFDAKANNTYMIFGSDWQFGFQGYQFTPGATISDYHASDPTGIKAITTKTEKVWNANAPMYNLSGQKVDKSYKGIVIQNGRKFFNK